MSEVIEHTQKMYNPLDFILFLLWEGPCSLGSLEAALPALDEYPSVFLVGRGRQDRQ